MSQRLDKLKREDPILDYDLIICFNTGLEGVKRNLNLPNYEVLLEFLPNGQDQYEQMLRTQYNLLISNQCTKQEQV